MGYRDKPNLNVILKKTLNCVLVISVVLFAVLLSQSYINHFVNIFIGKFNYSLELAKYTYIIAVISLSIYGTTKIKIFNLKLCLNILLILAIYTLYRFNYIAHSNWEFAQLFHSFLYADALYLFLFLILWPCRIKIKKKLIALLDSIFRNDLSKKKPLASDGGDFMDKAIELEALDKFSYYSDAEQFAKMIINNRKNTTNNALIVGLQGKWGQGKTSYLNMFSLAIDKKYKKEAIVLRYNAWLNHSYNQIAHSLLGSIGKGIDDITIQNTINDYTKVITGANLGWWSKVVDAFIGIHKEYADELFDKVSDLIGGLDKLLIIQIDDIDRLTGNEIFNVIKLIRNIANFKNTVFIVAYDREYVVSSLEKINIKEDYLEKIFNIPFSLPTVTPDVLKSTMKVRLKLIFNNSINESSHIDKFIDIVGDDLSLRNAIRLSSGIKYTWSNLLDSEDCIMVSLLDFLLITYLSMINMDIYMYLSQCKPNNGFIYDNEMCKYLLTNSGSKFTLEYKRSQFSDNHDSKEKLTEDEYKQEKLKPIVGEKNLDLIYTILKELFKERIGIYQISYINSYTMYFTRRFEKKMIRKIDFDKAVHEGSFIFKKNLIHWCENNDHQSLYQLISNMEYNSSVKWIQVFNDVLSIMPLRYLPAISSSFEEEKKYQLISLPGINIFHKDYTPKNNDIRLCYNSSLLMFLFNEKVFESDSIEVIQKKFTLYLYLSSSFLPINVHFYGENSLSEINILKLFWNAYSKDIISYADFNEDFWYIVSRFYHNEKIEVRDIFISHIRDNIISFIKHYPIVKLQNSNIHYLFHGYIITSDSTATHTDRWLPDFIVFLKSIAEMMELDDLNDYIAKVESINQNN